MVKKSCFVFVSIFKKLAIQHIQKVLTCEFDRASEGSLPSRYTGCISN